MCCKPVLVRAGEQVVNLAMLGGWERTANQAMLGGWERTANQVILFSPEGSELCVLEGKELEEFEAGVRGAMMKGAVLPIGRVWTIGRDAEGEGADGKEAGAEDSAA